MTTDKRIDRGAPFDWGRASEDYAKYRDNYPDIFYKKIKDRNLCVNGQKVLDLGTGTGVLPRNMYKYGAEWTGTDISSDQIEEAKRLAADSDMNIDFFASSAEDLRFPDSSFDTVTACQCFWYFDHSILVPKLARLLKKDGRLLILYMAWLPFEDEIAAQSEKLVLKYNPSWSGGGETVKPIDIPDEIKKYFELTYHEEYKISVPFTRESWHGRMRACRGTGASLDEKSLAEWDREHRAFLLKSAPEKFNVLHYAAMAELTLK